jgi:hypothetical protein
MDETFRTHTLQLAATLTAYVCSGGGGTTEMLALVSENGACSLCTAEIVW